MGAKLLDLSAFMRILRLELSKWLEIPSLSVTHAAVSRCLIGIQGWLTD